MDAIESLSKDKGVGLKGWLSGPKTKNVEDGGKREKAGPMDGRRFAVLPFLSLSPDPNDEYFADGLTEELISRLSRLKGLEVIARTSVMNYKKEKKNAGQIGRELKAGTLLEGSVRKVGKKIRVTTQLIDSNTEGHLWVENYDRELEDVFAIQTDISERVVQALKLRAFPGTEESRVRQFVNTEAYEHCLRGRYFWNRGTFDSFMKALEEFEKAIEKDPECAPAYSGLADTYLLLGRNGDATPKFAYPKAIQYASKALTLDEQLAQPHVALAAIRQEYEWKWEESGAEFLRAIELDPSYATAHGWYALYLGHIGQTEKAIQHANRAQELDPLSPRIPCTVSEEYLFARNYDKAIETAERALEIDPNYGGAHGYVGYPYVAMGMYDRAIAEFQKGGKLLGARAWLGRLGHVYGLSGRREEAMKILEDLRKEPIQPPATSPFIPPPPDTSFDTGLVYLGLGEHKQAISWLEKAADEHTAEIIHIKCEPIYDNLQADPDFKALIRRIGLAS